MATIIPAARHGPAGAVLAACLVLAAPRLARGDLLPNELPGDSPLTVTVRGALGRYFRPGRPVLLEITIQNEGEPFDADVRVRESRSGGEAVFRGPRRVRLARGSSTHEILAAPAGGAAGTVLEVVRLPPQGQEGEGEPVFRGDLSRVLRPLGREERLLLAVGLRAFPAPPWRNWSDLSPYAVVPVEPSRVPRDLSALAAADVIVIEAVDGVSPRPAAALADYVRGGGRLVLASFSATRAAWSGFFGAPATVPESVDSLMDLVPDARKTAPAPGVMPARVEFPFGQGSVAVFDARTADTAAWASAPKALATFMENFTVSRRFDAWVDPAVFGDLTLEHPMRSAADRAKTIALVGALAACVAVALFVRRRRLVAACVLGGVALAWATAAALVWGAPEGASRVVRVRAFTEDGRAEIVTDTVVVSAFGETASVGVETLVPGFPVAHREGELLAVPYVLGRAGDGWRTEIEAHPRSPAILRSRRARRLDGESEALRKQVLASGRRVRAERLPGGRRRFEFAGEEPAADVRYLVETFAPPGNELAWLWIEGTPEGVRLLPEGRVDPAPGSGALVIAAVPADK